jgi:hypothetical protein
MRCTGGAAFACWSDVAITYYDTSIGRVVSHRYRFLVHGRGLTENLVSEICTQDPFSTCMSMSLDAAADTRPEAPRPLVSRTGDAEYGCDGESAYRRGKDARFSADR